MTGQAVLRPTGEVLSSVLAALGVVDHRAREQASHAERLEWLAAARDVARRVDGLVTTLVAEADRAGSSTAVAGTPTTTYLAQDGRTSIGDASKAVLRAKDVASRKAVQAATLTGEIETGQASAITRLLGELPRDLTAEQKDAAERFLLDKASSTPASRIPRLRQATLDAIRPETAETREAEMRRLDEQRRRAVRRRFLRFDDDGDGSLTFRGSLPYLEAAPFRQLIEAYVESSRRKARRDGTDQMSFTAQRQADALTDLVTNHLAASGLTVQGAGGGLTRANSGTAAVGAGTATVDRGTAAMDAGSTPAGGGAIADGPADAPTDEPGVDAHQRFHFRIPEVAGQLPRIQVTMREADLREMVEQAGLLADGAMISPGELRRLCCDAELVPCVLGSASEVLDLGRSVRLVSPKLRRALELRDGGCTFPGCDSPPSRCEAHHIVPWYAGGPTALNNLVLLCPHHHGVVEPPRFHTGPPPNRWQVKMGADGIPEFIRPAGLRGHPPTRAGDSAPGNRPGSRPGNRSGSPGVARGDPPETQPLWPDFDNPGPPPEWAQLE